MDAWAATVASRIPEMAMVYDVARLSGVALAHGDTHLRCPAEICVGVCDGFALIKAVAMATILTVIEIDEACGLA